MQMLNVRRPAPRPLPRLPKSAAGQVGCPSWWTANDDADRNVAQAGCRRAGQNCLRCSAERCPLALRVCGVCSHFDSARGLAGLCRLSASPVVAGDTCEGWEARV